MTSLQMGETMPNIAKDMDTYSYTLPLGKAIALIAFNCSYKFVGANYKDLEASMEVRLRETS